jgi:hypothetical protein
LKSVARFGLNSKKLQNKLTLLMKVGGVTYNLISMEIELSPNQSQNNIESQTK